MVENYKKVEINRLWHGFASVRDYLVEQAKKERKDLLIVLRNANEQMTISHAELEKGKKNTEKFKSKHDDKIYCLIDYNWKPDIDKQVKLF